MIDLLFKCLDAIDSYVENIKATSDEGTDENEAIIKELNDFIQKEEGETTEQAQPEKPAEEEHPAEASDGGNDDKFSLIEVTDNEKKAIDEAKEAGQKIYGMTVYIQKECLLKAARAFLVFRAVEEFGTDTGIQTKLTGYRR